MARNGSGTYIRTDGVRTGATVFAQEQSAGINILATNLDYEAQDMADALTQSLSKDGQTVPTANLPMGGFKLTGLANGSALTDSVAYGQVANLAMGLEWKTGLLVSNNVSDADHDIDIAVGSIMDTTNVYRINLTSALTIPIDAVFNVAAGGGRSDQDSLSNNTGYGVFLLSKSTNPSDTKAIFATTLAKSLTDTVAVAAGYDISRYRHWVLTDSSANIIPNIDGGDGWNVWDVPIATGATASLSAVSTTVAAPPFMRAQMRYHVESEAASTSTTNGLISQLDQTDSNPSTSAYADIMLPVQSAASVSLYGEVIKPLKVNGSSQIRHREYNNVAVGDITINLTTQAWIISFFFSLPELEPK